MAQCNKERASNTDDLAVRASEVRSLAPTKRSVRNCISSRVAVSGDTKGRVFSEALGDACDSEEVFEDSSNDFKEGLV